MNLIRLESRRFFRWACLWGGGIAWLLHFLAIWVCAEFGCISGFGVAGPLGISKVAWLVIGITLGFLALGGLAFHASWRWCPRDQPIDQFVARLGMRMNAVFVVVIAVQSLPVFFHLKSCGSAIG